MNFDFSSIIFAVVVVAGMGLLIGLILAVSAAVMAVKKDETAEKVLEVLPGANCGACGFSGCSGYAEALSKGEAKPGLCPVGGEECAKDVAAVLGVEAGAVEYKTALVHCMGNCDNTQNKAIYDGITSCAAAAKVGAGVTACSYGCIGLGDCERACPYGAISVCNGVALVDKDKCRGCSVCVKTCPRHIISFVSDKDQAVVRCSNKDKGAVSRKACAVSCIGCKKCEKVCEAGAVTVTDFCAFVDERKCTACFKCVENCPQGCITLFDSDKDDTVTLEV